MGEGVEFLCSVHYGVGTNEDKQLLFTLMLFTVFKRFPING